VDHGSHAFRPQGRKELTNPKKTILAGLVAFAGIVFALPVGATTFYHDLPNDDLTYQAPIYLHLTEEDMPNCHTKIYKTLMIYQSLQETGCGGFPTPGVRYLSPIAAEDDVFVIDCSFDRGDPIACAAQSPVGFGGWGKCAPPPPINVSWYIFCADDYHDLDPGEVGEAQDQIVSQIAFYLLNGEGSGTSTSLEAALAAVLPTFGWDEATGTGNGMNTHVLTEQLNENIGNATATFPVCLTYNWLDLVDQFQGMTQGTIGAQRFHVTSNLGTPSTLNLDLSRSTVATGTAFNGIVDKIQLFWAALEWFLFGAFVWWDLFIRGKGNDEV
jgi:hypothetical protein